jgi:nucleoid-associated protein YgaU
LRKAHPAERSPGGKKVRVGPGETLRTIAKREYGDEGAWEQIYQANLAHVKDAESPEIGTELTLP